MQNGKYGKGITKRAMDNMPEIKNLLRPREEQDALGQRRLPPRNANGALQLGIARLQNSK